MACARKVAHKPFMLIQLTGRPETSRTDLRRRGIRERLQSASLVAQPRHHARLAFMSADLQSRRYGKRLVPMPSVAGRLAHRKVDIAAVREVIGSISQREFTKGIVITTSGFTSAARQEAERPGVALYDGERLLWLLRHHLHREFNIIDQSRRQPPFKKRPRLGTDP